MPHNSDAKSLEFAVCIGMALSAWSGFEIRLAALFGILTDMPDGAKAADLFDVVNSFEVRFAMCDRLMEREEVDPWEAEVWSAFFKLGRRLYRKRHEVAHFSIIGAREDGEETVRLSPFFSNAKLIAGKARYLTVADIKNQAQKFDELREAIVWFWHRAMIRRGAQALVGPAQEAPLIARLQASNPRTQPAAP